jgi:hypothetical protein
MYSHSMLTFFQLKERKKPIVINCFRGCYGFLSHFIKELFFSILKKVRQPFEELSKPEKALGWRTDIH